MAASSSPCPLSVIVTRLRAVGCVFAEDEARLIISAARTPADLAAMVDRRAAGLPLEHVLGWAEFCGLRIAVDPRVFVPRRRTELLVRQAAALVRQGASPAGQTVSATGHTFARPPVVVVDLCCGSGAVGAALVAALGRVELYAVDIDPAAVRCARRNLATAGAQVYEGDLYQPLPASLRGRVDVLVANAPYVPTEAIGLLPPEARIHEPRVALDGGVDGLDVQRRVITSAPLWLAPGGYLLIETSERQVSQTVDTFTRNGLIPRVVRSDEYNATVVIGTRPSVGSSTRRLPRVVGHGYAPMTVRGSSAGHSRVVIGAPASGSGKTTVATGLMAALRRRGTAVAGFKVGPDYIDPGYHALATGRPGRNLDPVLVGEQRIAPLAAHGSVGAHVTVVEGVMGLFDGRSATAGHGSPECGSTAHVAALLGAPVLLVVDVRGQGRSLAALLHGFRSFDPGGSIGRVRIGGVVLNRVGSARHEQICRDACAEVGLPVLGALRRDDALAVPSRHLGLMTAAEHTAATEVVARWADAVAAQVDLNAVVSLGMMSLSTTASAAPRWESTREVTPVPGEPVIAMAAGPAFTFGYPEHAELLAAAGAVVAPFDPLRDESLPPGTAGMVLPGGFPEEHALELSANASLRAEVAALARSGAPVHAECGGLLYLCRLLDGAPMCGVLDAEAVMTSRLVLGYRDAVALRSSVCHPEGARVSGHEFHRTVVTPRASASAWAWSGAKPEGFVQGSVHASFLHTHPAGHPSAVARFVANCAKGTP